ncbi:MAG: CDGSH iron-sulfur domain-containing protein, partial [Bacteroidia bacterium]
DASAIMKQIDQCPSAALSYVQKNKAAVTQSETAEETIVEIVPNGPVLVYGNITVKDTSGQLTNKNKVSAFCRCGASSNKPYCDGTHRKIDFKDPQ